MFNLCDRFFYLFFDIPMGLLIPFYLQYIEK